MAGRSLLTLLFLSATVIGANFLIGIFAPILNGLEDEISFLDTIWRATLGQHAGVDFHNPMGFGPFYLGALLWHWLGPHYYVMRLANTLFSLSIAFCGCVVAQRTLARRPDLALLFCVTLAFLLSAPTGYEGSRTDLGMAGIYNRHVVSALSILFLQTFGGASAPRRTSTTDIVLAAVLLNVLFLTKISGVVLGLMILFAGCLLRGRTTQQVVALCATVLVFATVTAIELKVTGLELTPIIQDYELAAHARLAYSFYDIIKAIFSGPLVGSLALLVFFAVSRWRLEPRLDFRCIGLIIGTYAACQFALNVTNVPGSSIWLAPVAAASLAICVGVVPGVPQLAGMWKAGGGDSLPLGWQRFLSEKQFRL